ncbi:MAG: chemotaxis protein CheW [Bdellovibrionota bacterium]
MASVSDSKSQEANVETRRFMEFSLGQENFAIPLLVVKEVIDIPQFTSVPYTPDYFLGIMNLRGQVLSAIDLRKKMKITPNVERNETAIIILDLDPYTLGVMVDSINSVLSLADSMIAPPPDFESRVDSEFITGVFPAEDKLTLIIDIRRLLNSKDLRILAANQDKKVS